MLETITEKSETSFRTKKTTEFPQPRDLAGHFHRFLKYWAGVDLEYQGPATQGGSKLPVELSVRLQGTVSGTLVLGCTPDFLKWLQANRDYKTLHLTTGADIFAEMTTLYCVYLIQQFWLSENFEVGPLLPRTSTPGQWPAREPNTSCRVQTGENHLELRLWVDERAEGR